MTRHVRHARADGRSVRRPAPRSPRGAASRPDDLLDLFSRTADGVMAVDPECRIILWNRSAESILGRSAAEVLGRGCHDVFRGRDEHGNLFCHPDCSVLVMARRDEFARPYDLVTWAKDRTERRLNISTVLVPSPRGNIVVHLFRDVTDARRQDRPPEPRLEERGDASAAAPSLTPREHEVLRLLARGESTLAIARQLFISTATVRNHAQNILTKLGAHSRLEAVALAFRSRALGPDTDAGAPSGPVDR
jgi:PAS domain S-box-containing protein